MGLNDHDNLNLIDRPGRCRSPYYEERGDTNIDDMQCNAFGEAVIKLEVPPTCAVVIHAEWLIQSGASYQIPPPGSVENQVAQLHFLTSYQRETPRLKAVASSLIEVVVL